jgi:class 3 adenylate cyclase
MPRFTRTSATIPDGPGLDPRGRSFDLPAGATRDLGRSFLASADALDRLSLDGAFALEDLGPQHLRGREAPVRVFAISEASTPEDAGVPRS